MSTAALTHWKNKLAAAKASTKRAREKAGEVMETALTAAEISGSAFALGVWAGRDPGAEFFGIEPPLAIGVAAHAAALFGVGRGMESHFRNVGNGALATHMALLGQKKGVEWKQTGKFTAGESDGPNLPPRRGAGITQADLEARLSR